MTADLKNQLARLQKRDRITATGVDTRGHKVTRTGALLWEPKEVNAQRDGRKTKGWRVFVGELGADPTDRSTWVTMFADFGTVELLDDNKHQEETPAREWQKHKMGDFVSWGGAPRYFRYGGLAKRKAEADGPMVRVRWAESRHGENSLVDVHTNEVVDVVHSMSKVWAIPATDEEIEAMPPLVELEKARPDYSVPPEEREESNDQVDEEPQPKPRKPVRSGVLFEGWLGDLDGENGYAVWDNARKRLIGWLSSDHSMFRPIGA
ncbi:hypothetical protein [Streptomyces californicus]|uniref:hypothetical protein n=1 Tax=Streptomyces californicus TaxID=67351 RepID=UPI003685EBBE